jgi:hypothetical protein
MFHFDDYVYASRFTPSGGWSTPELLMISDGTTNTTSSLDLAVDPSGNALAFYSTTGSLMSLNASYYDNQSGTWGAPVSLQGSGSVISGHSAAFDNTGSAMLVYSYWNGASSSRPDIWANRFTAGTNLGTAQNPTGWGSAALVERDNLGPATYPDIVHTGNGQFRAVWGQSDGNYTHVWENRFTP